MMDGVEANPTTQFNKFMETTNKKAIEAVHVYLPTKVRDIVFLRASRDSYRRNSFISH